MHRVLHSTTLTFVLIAVGRCLDQSSPHYAKLVECRESRSKWVPQEGNAEEADRLMAGCLKELLVVAGLKFRTGKGIPELGIEPEDPFEPPPFRMNAPEIKLDGNVTNVRIVGAASAYAEPNIDVVIRTAEKKGEVKLRIKQLRTTGEFDASVNILGSLFPGLGAGNGQTTLRGTLDSIAEDMEATFPLILRRSSDPKEGMKITNIGVRLAKARVIKVTMKPRFTGTETAAERRQQESLFSLMSAASASEDMRRMMHQNSDPTVIKSMVQSKYILLTKGLDNIDLL